MAKKISRGDSIKISEIFYSIQGEGVNLGKPSIFVRLAGCNLRCPWCDTKYAYDGIEMTNEDVINKIKEYPCKHVVWTGGEPTLQQKDVYKIIKKLAGYTHELETNGTVDFNPAWFDVVHVSPKKERINYELLMKFNKFFNNVYFKFVIENKESFDFWLKKIEELGLDKDRVIFMPEGTDPKKLYEKSLYLIEWCKDNNIRFSPRAHIMFWGKKKGV